MKKIKNTLMNTMLIAAILTFCWSGYNMYLGQNEKNEAVRDFGKIRELAIQEVPDEEKRIINWEELHKINPDIKAWIWIEDTPIDYPVTQGSDNMYYLKHNYKKEYSNYGSIYLSYDNSTKFDEENTMIFGHNTTYKDAMFSEISEMYKNPNKEYKVHYYTPEKDYEIELFSIYDAPTQSESYRWKFNDSDHYQEYLNRAQSLSIMDKVVDVTTEDKIITLYTCDLVTGKSWKGVNGSRIFVHGIVREV